MNIKKLLAMMSVSTIPAMAPAAVSASIQGSGQEAGAGIFTLSAGPVPVTERTRQGERKLMALEEAYARELGCFPQELSGAAKTDRQQLAMRSVSKVLECLDNECNVAIVSEDPGF